MENKNITDQLVDACKDMISHEELFKKVKIRKVGNSHVITIPKTLMSGLNLKENDEMMLLSPQNSALIFSFKVGMELPRQQANQNNNQQCNSCRGIPSSCPFYNDEREARGCQYYTFNANGNEEFCDLCGYPFNDIDGHYMIDDEYDDVCYECSRNYWRCELCNDVMCPSDTKFERDGYECLCEACHDDPLLRGGG